MSVIVRRITGVSDSERILLVSVIPGGANEKKEPDHNAAGTPDDHRVRPRDD